MPLKSGADAATANEGTTSRRRSRMRTRGRMGFLRRCWRAWNRLLRFMGLLGWRGRSRSILARDGRLRRSGPARNIFLRDFAHRIRDWDVRNAILLVDPTRAVELSHFPVAEPRHVRRWIDLKLGIWIAPQGQAQGAVGGRPRANH